MSAAYQGGSVNNRVANDTTDLYAPTDNWGGTPIATNDSVIVFGTWQDADAPLRAWDFGGLAMTELGHVKHSTAEFYLGAAIVYGLASQSEAVVGMLLNTGLSNRSMVVMRYSGLRYSGTPFVEVKTGESTGSTSISAASANPGGAGVIIAGFAALTTGETFTAGGSYTNRLTADQMTAADYVTSGASTASSTGSGTSKKLAMALAFRDSTAGAAAIYATGSTQVLGV